jgi:TetR/AcrR family transcriptional repressor of lmrAB and yxaGH operons
MADQQGQERGRATREKLLIATEELLASRGAHGAGLTDVCALSGVAYGSLYHQFPKGKNELVAASIRRSGEGITDVLEAILASMPLVEAVTAMFAGGAQMLERSQFTRGCPVGTPAISGDDDELIEAAAAAFQRWSALITAAARRNGIGARPAAELASALVSLYEGSLLVARAERSSRPIRAAAAVAKQLCASRLDK